MNPEIVTGIFTLLSSGSVQGHAGGRRDTIIMNMTEAMKALSPPPQDTSPEPRESPQMAEEAPEGAEPRPGTGEAQEGVQRPWWRRVFGG